MARPLPILALLLLILVPACGLLPSAGGSVPVNLETAVALTVQALPTQSVEDTPVPNTPVVYLPPSLTPVGQPASSTPAATPVSGCTDNAQFLVDVTVPDGTRLAPNATFTKTWRLKNTGTCMWTGSYSLAFVGGERMGGPDRVGFAGNVSAGSEYEISVQLAAPAALGQHSGQWRLVNPAGQTFGTNDAPLTVMINTGTAATATPTAPPVSPTPACDDAQFLADVAVPDGTRFAPGAIFTKTWRVKNTGSCTWNTSYYLGFVGGEKMSGPDRVTLSGAVAPNAEYEISVQLKAPTAPGSYSGQWRLHNAAGQPFGTRGAPLTVIVTVDAALATATAGAPKPNLTLASVGVDSSNHVRVTVKNPSTVNAPSTFRVDVYLNNSKINSMDIGGLAPGASATITADGGTVPGSVAGRVVIDSLGAIAENDENDNDHHLYFFLPVAAETAAVRSDGTVFTNSAVAGDEASVLYQEAFLSWDIASVGGKAVKYAAIDFLPVGREGDPFGRLGPLQAYEDQWGIVVPDGSFINRAGGSLKASFGSEAITGLDLTASLASYAASSIKRYQMRFEFSKTTDANGVTDKATFDLSQAYLIVAYR